MTVVSSTTCRPCCAPVKPISPGMLSWTGISCWGRCKGCFKCCISSVRLQSSLIKQHRRICLGHLFTTPLRQPCTPHHILAVNRAGNPVHDHPETLHHTLLCNRAGSLLISRRISPSVAQQHTHPVTLRHILPYNPAGNPVHDHPDIPLLAQHVNRSWFPRVIIQLFSSSSL